MVAKLSVLIVLLLISSLATGQTKIGGTAKVGGTTAVGIATSGPVDFVTDTFTDTDNTVLSSHTGEVGATWTQHPACTTGTIIILSNRAHKDTASGNGCYFASGVPANANYTVEVLEVDLTAVGLASRACGWMSTTGTFSAVCVGRQNTTAVELIKFIAGTGTQLDTAAVTFTTDQIRTLKLTRTGNDFEWFLDDVSQGVFTITDTEVSGAGRAGIRMNSSWSANTVFPMNSLRAYQ
jgi:hypothetical protein